MSSHQPEDAEALAHALTRGQLMRLLEYVQGAQKAQNQNANAALLVTTFAPVYEPPPTGEMYKKLGILIRKRKPSVPRWLGGCIWLK